MSLADRVNELWVCHLGLIPYSDALTIQGMLRERRLAGELPDTLLLLEHPPTYTRGRRSEAQDLPFPESFYRDKGIEVHDTNRGGKLTYHGPGQLVGYPIVAVRDIHGYLRTTEGAVVQALAEEGIRARSRHAEGIDYTGVWVQDRKIASIGVHVSHGIATHGFAVNVDNDLEPFSWVLACGLPDVTMTSLAAELQCSNQPRMPCFRKRIAYSFASAVSRRQRLVSRHRLGIDTTNPSTLKIHPIPYGEPALA